MTTPLPRRRFLQLGGAVAATTMLAACGSDDAKSADASPTTTAPAASSTTKPTGPPKKLTLGFIALTDSSPLIMAKELGFFDDHGLDVTLVKQASWPATRDNLLSGQIDGAHCLSTM